MKKHVMLVGNEKLTIFAVNINPAIPIRCFDWVA